MKTRSRSYVSPNTLGETESLANVGNDRIITRRRRKSTATPTHMGSSVKRNPSEKATECIEETEGNSKCSRKTIDVDDEKSILLSNKRGKRLRNQNVKSPNGPRSTIKKKKKGKDLQKELNRTKRKESYVQNVSSNEESYLQIDDNVEIVNDDDSLCLRRRHVAKNMPKSVVKATKKSKSRTEKDSKSLFRENTEDENSSEKEEYNSEYNLYSPNILRSLLEEESYKKKELQGNKSPENISKFESKLNLSVKKKRNSEKYSAENVVDLKDDCGHSTEIAADSENDCEKVKKSPKKSRHSEEINNSKQEKINMLSNENLKEIDDFAEKRIIAHDSCNENLVESENDISIQHKRNRDKIETNLEKMSSSGSEINIGKKKINIQGIIIEEIDKFEIDEEGNKVDKFSNKESNESNSDDNDSSPEEVTFCNSQKEALFSLRDAENEIKKIKLKAKESRSMFHNRNLKQKEEKRKRILELESKKLPDNILSDLSKLEEVKQVEHNVGTLPKKQKVSKINESPMVSHNHIEEEFISIHGRTEFKVCRLDNFSKKQTSIAENAKNWKHEMLFGNRNKRESVREMMFKNIKQAVSGKYLSFH